MAIWKRAIKSLLLSKGYVLAPISESLPESLVTRVEDHGLNRLMENFVDLATAEANRRGLPVNEQRVKLLARQYGTPPTEAFFILEALLKTQHVPGDVCEFGCAQGVTTRTMANELLAGDKVLHAFDSFEGLPKPSEKDRLKDDIFKLDRIEAYAGQMACPEEMVRAELEASGLPWRRYMIHKGFVERILDGHATEILPTQVSFAYIDVDWYEGIKVCLSFLHPITPSGAIVIVDDYKFFSDGGQRAVDEFLAEQVGVYEMAEHDCGPKGHFAVLTKQ